MDRREFALAAMAGAEGKPFTPVQLQKLLFLLNENIGPRIGGTGYNFVPYHYGPFDSAVYTTMAQLRDEGMAAIVATGDATRREYALTEAGQALGTQLLNKFDAPVSKYVRDVCGFVLSQSFASLVSSIYNAYPGMKVNSVFHK
jgi:hypothetical protein